MHTRPFPALSTATTIFVGSTAGGQLVAASNSLRAELRVQPLTDHFRVGPLGSMSASAGFYVGATTILTVPAHVGALYAMPVGAATSAILVWESGM